MPSSPLLEKLFQNVWNEGQLEILQEILSPDFTVHFPDGTLRGPDVLKEVVDTWRTAFPDLCHEIDDTILTDNKVIVRWHGNGTHLGVFMGLLPTHRKMSYSGITIFHVKNNQFTDAWVSADVSKIMQQLEVYSDKIYTDGDFSVDFKGPAGEIYRWIMNARATPACKQKMINALRNQFATAPVNNQPALVIPDELFSEVTVQEIYIPTKTGKVRGLIHYPRSAEKKLLPLLIYMHGGGWSIGDPDEAILLTRKLAYTSEIIVLSLDYRLAPEYPYPSGLDDCVEVYEWARSNAHDTLNADQNKIAVAGDSSGGNFALTIALRLRDEGKKVPDAVLALCPLTDFLFEKYPSALHFGPNSLVYDFAFLSFVRSIYSPYPLWKHPHISPMYAEFTDFSPTFVLIAGQDLLFDENKLFVEKLKQAKVDVESLIHEDMPHAYYYFLGLSKEEDLAYQAFAKFLKRVLKY